MGDQLKRFNRRGREKSVRSRNWGTPAYLLASVSRGTSKMCSWRPIDRGIIIKINSGSLPAGAHDNDLRWQT